MAGAGVREGEGTVVGMRAAVAEGIGIEVGVLVKVWTGEGKGVAGTQAVNASEQMTKSSQGMDESTSECTCKPGPRTSRRTRRKEGVRYGQCSAFEGMIQPEMVNQRWKIGSRVGQRQVFLDNRAAQPIYISPVEGPCVHAS